MARPKQLGVWLGDVLVAHVQRRGPVHLRLQYTAEAIERWPANSPVLSCSLPLGRAAMPAGGFLAGLLPEGRALAELATRAGVSTTDTFALLQRYGRDVAGALVISADAPDERRFGVEEFTPPTLAYAVAALDEQPLGVGDDSELSLAGLQDKLLLVQTESGGWGRPLRGRPSTHILKRDDARYPGLVAAEEGCLRLGRALGLTTVETELAEIGDEPCLIVSRFDRVQADDGAVVRVHQEDLLQATGIHPSQARGRVKYEDAGGPSLLDLATLLDRHAVDGVRELEALVQATTFTVLIGNADAHAKNLALLFDSPQTVRLAPLYDSVPTALWPKLRTRAAMSIGGRTDLAAVTLDDIVAEAARWPLAASHARAAAVETCQRALDFVQAGRLDDLPALKAYVAVRAQALV